VYPSYVPETHLVRHARPRRLGTERFWNLYSNEAFKRLDIRKLPSRDDWCIRLGGICEYRYDTGVVFWETCGRSRVEWVATPVALLRLNSSSPVVSTGVSVRKSESVIGSGCSEVCLGGRP